MRPLVLPIILFLSGMAAVSLPSGAQAIPTRGAEDTAAVMSAAY